MSQIHTTPERDDVGLSPSPSSAHDDRHCAHDMSVGDVAGDTVPMPAPTAYLRISRAGRVLKRSWALSSPYTARLWEGKRQKKMSSSDSVPYDAAASSEVDDDAEMVESFLTWYDAAAPDDVCEVFPYGGR